MEKLAGVYKITNLENGKVYIGESEDIQKRWKQHKNKLKCKDHENYKIQKDYNLYGKDCFKYEIVELISHEQNYILLKMRLLILEDKYIKKYNSIKNGYNIERTVKEIMMGNKYVISSKNDRRFLINYYFKENSEKIFTALFNKYNIEDNINFTCLNDLYLYFAKNMIIRYKNISDIKKVFLSLGIICKNNDNKYIFNNIYLSNDLLKNENNNNKIKLMVSDKGKIFLLHSLKVYKEVRGRAFKNESLINFMIE